MGLLDATAGRVDEGAGVGRGAPGAEGRGAPGKAGRGPPGRDGRGPLDRAGRGAGVTDEEDSFVGAFTESKTDILYTGIK